MFVLRYCRICLTPPFIFIGAQFEFRCARTAFCRCRLASQRFVARFVAGINLISCRAGLFAQLAAKTTVPSVN